jgi:putative ABC transport system permease protein
MKQDLRFALRLLAKRPAFSALAVITLALGIGANTVIFSGLYVLLLQSLPYPHVDRLLVMSQTGRAGEETGVSYPDFTDWKAQSATFEEFAATYTTNANVTVDGSIERTTGSYVSGDFFPLLGARAQLGRIFNNEEHRPGAPRVVALSYLYWQRRFGSNPAIIGREVKINDETFTVVGVLGEKFLYPFRTAFWTPLEANDKPELLADRTANNYEVIGRLKAGKSVEAAVHELRAINERAAPERHANRDLVLQATKLRESVSRMAKYGAPLAALQLAVVFVLLIASVNLANLLLARHTERRGEFALRLALGASRARLIRQLLIEAAIIGAVGCGLGLAGARWGISALRAAFYWRMPGLSEIGINAPVLLFTLVVSLLVTVAFGLLPAIIASRQDLNEWLKAGAASATSDPRNRRLSNILIAAEVALAVMLLTISGLMIRTVLNLTKEDPGFKAEHAVAVSLSLSPSRYPTKESLAAYYDESIRRIEALPGVEAVGGVSYMPLVGYNPGANFTLEGRPAANPGEALRADYQPITPAYFRAIGMPLISGREFNAADMKPVPTSAIVNQAFARKFLSDGDPTGKQIQIQNHASPVLIVGVVGDVRQFGLQNNPRAEIYVPAYRTMMTLIVRTGGDPGALFAPLREVVQSLDDKAALNMKTMEQAVADSMEKRRIFAWLLGVLGGAALILAALGIYGVISYATAQRTREFGLRLALGAQKYDLLRLVIWNGLKLVAIGATVGFVGSLAMTRVIKSMLYGVGAADPLTLAGIIAVLAAVAVAACYLPARRASRVDPIRALRYE